MTGRLLFLRHGETTGESSVRYWGRTDIPLSEEGRAMARAAAGVLAGEPIARVVTSRLARSKECGRLALGGRAVPEQVIPELDEIDFGRWEGLTRAEIAARDPDRFAEWQRAAGDFQFPGGESRAQFEARVRRGYALLDRCWFDGCMLFALHRGVIRNLLRLFLADADPGDRLSVDLGALTIISRAANGWQLEALNRTDFLGNGR